MPITILDLVLLGVMLISGLLAMVRGFMREILSIAAWGAAALVTLYAFAKLLPTAKDLFQQRYNCGDSGRRRHLYRHADRGLGHHGPNLRHDPGFRIGALDRTLGFLFGLGRGLLIVVVAFLFFTWLVPDKQRPDWITGAKSRVVLQGTGDWLMSLLPDDPENTILKRFKKNKPEDDQTDADQATPASGDGYSKPARDGLKKLIEKPAGTLITGQIERRWTRCRTLPIPPANSIQILT